MQDLERQKFVAVLNLFYKTLLKSILFLSLKYSK